MNIVTDAKSQLTPEANLLAAYPTATGILTVDLDAIIANWRKLEKTAVPAECAAVVKANAYGCGAFRRYRGLLEFAPVGDDGVEVDGQDAGGGRIGRQQIGFRR
ncbi:alanine racemase, partial [Bradyrhizobium sp.]|uniref:alanine racemase n=1 Tax=Bradyrhizobium sp. TaxID=376 RepID=UPI00391CE413